MCLEMTRMTRKEVSVLSVSISQSNSIDYVYFFRKRIVVSGAVHTTPAKFENTTISSQFGFVFEENSWCYRFLKALFSKCFSQSRGFHIPPVGRAFCFSVRISFPQTQIQTHIVIVMSSFSKSSVFKMFFPKPAVLNSFDWRAICFGPDEFGR